MVRYKRPKKKNKASKAQRLRRKREIILEKIENSEQYVPEDAHVEYFKRLPEDNLPDLEIEKIIPECVVIGNRIVDMQHIFQQIMKLQEHSTIDKCFGTLRLTGEKRIGLYSKMTVTCTGCYKKFMFCTHKQDSINQKFVWGTLSVGNGYAQSSEFLTVLDIPPISKNCFMKNEVAVGKTWEDALTEQMKETAEIEKSFALEQGNIEHGLPYITVIVDGGWAKRSYGHGYNSNSGVACIIGHKTKKLLYIGVKNRFCLNCHFAEKNKTSNDHVCFKNYKGPPTSMEQEIIVQGFIDSEERYGLRYKYFIADGDASVYARIVQNVPYGRFVHKLECANHVTRAFTSNLHKLAKNTSFDISGRRILRLNLQRLSTSLRSAISNNKGINTLRQDLVNIPQHVFGNHSNCRLDYCKRMDRNEENFIPLLTSCKLYVEIVKLIENVVRKADRLIANETTNSAERYMSLVAKFTGGKRINFTQRGSYQRRCIAAGLSFNAGPSWHGNFLNCNLVRNYCINRQKQLERVRQQRRRRQWKCKSIGQVTTSNDYGADAATIDISDEELNKEKQKILDILQEESNNRDTIWNNTVGQTKNMLWHQIRRHRLTASNFHSVCVRRKTTPCHNLLKKNLYTNQNVFHNNKAISYGIINESVAIRKYEELYAVKVEQCGIFISKSHPYLAASPCGRIGNTKLIEVKCLYSIRDENITEVAKKKNSLGLQFSDNKLSLKKNHKYLYQIQGQLNIIDIETCDLILYTNNDLAVIQISKDSNFYQNMSQTLVKFYELCMLPELANPRIPRGMKARN